MLFAFIGSSVILNGAKGLLFKPQHGYSGEKMITNSTTTLGRRLETSKPLSYLLPTTLCAIVLLIAGCQQSGKDDTTNTASNGSPESSSQQSGLSEWELTNGIGPVTEPFALSSNIDTAQAKEGESIFESKCAMCHKLDERYVGPELGNVLAQRSPEYVVNMIMNPLEMTAKHPEARKMLGEYMNQMPYQNVTLVDAKKILEYLRSIEKSQ